MRKRITSLLLILLVLVVSLPVLSKENLPYMVKEFAVKPGGNLQVNTSGGSISVTGTNENKAIVEVMISGNKVGIDKAKIDELVKQYTISIRQENNSINANAEKKDKNWKDSEGLSISFRIKVPSQAVCNLNTSGGGISVNNIKGNTTVETSGGSISLSKIYGNLDAKTSGGSISLSDAEGKLNVLTSGGSIKLTNVSGDIVAQTSGGSISTDIVKLGKYLTLETTGGSVNATIPKGKGLDLDLSANNVKADLTNFKGESDKTHVKGTINGGGIPIKLNTSAGSAQLSYRM